MAHTIYRLSAALQTTPSPNNLAAAIAKPGGVDIDALFVPAHAVHRFSSFSADFATWVAFF